VLGPQRRVLAGAARSALIACAAGLCEVAGRIKGLIRPTDHPATIGRVAAHTAPPRGAYPRAYSRQLPSPKNGRGGVRATVCGGAQLLIASCACTLPSSLSRMRLAWLHRFRIFLFLLFSLFFLLFALFLYFLRNITLFLDGYFFQCLVLSLEAL